MRHSVLYVPHEVRLDTEGRLLIGLCSFSFVRLSDCTLYGGYLYEPKLIRGKVKTPTLLASEAIVGAGRRPSLLG